MNDPQVEKKIAELAKTLKDRGIAATESRAREMATDIIRTELKQQRAFDERKNKPEFSPQQRVGGEPAPGPQAVPEPTPALDAMKTGTIAGVDGEKSIGELLADAELADEESEEPEPVMEEPTPEPEPDTEELDESIEELEEVIEETKEIIEENKDLEEPTPEGTPEEPEEPDITIEEEETTPAETKSETPEQGPNPPKPKSAESSVDLSEMFNYGKR